MKAPVISLRIVGLIVLMLTLGLLSNTTPALAAEPDYTGATFGVEMSPAGDVNGDGYADVLVSAPKYNSSAGMAFLFMGSADGAVLPAEWSATGIAASSYGQRMGAGDFNNDGYSDIAIGARDHESSYGMVEVYLGSSSGAQDTAHWSQKGALPHSNFGFSVSGGDVDGDGIDDLIVGASSDHGDASDYWEGRVYIYKGATSGLNTTPMVILEGNQQYSRFGYATAVADVNGDGIGDVIVGAFQWTAGQSHEGRVSVFHGKAGGPAATPDWTYESNQADSKYGTFVASAGDVNGDGKDDVLVGTPNYAVQNGSDVLANAGIVHLFMGSAVGLGNSPAWTGEGASENNVYGNSIAGSGDVNGDGYDDVIIGHSPQDGTPENRGRASVYLGSAAGLQTTPAWTEDGTQEGERFGVAVRGVGDMNKDGYDDVVVAAYLHDGDFSDEGRVWGYAGSDQGLETTAFWSTGPADENGQAGVYLPMCHADS